MSIFDARSPEASNLRRRKYELVRQYSLPEGLLGGCLSNTHRRCGKSNCHCATGEGHPLWSITSSQQGKRRVERVPEAWRQEVEEAALKTQTYIAAVKEVMAINVELLAQTRRQQRQKVRGAKMQIKKNTPT